MHESTPIPRGHLVLASLVTALVLVGIVLLPSEPSDARKTFSLEPRALQQPIEPAAVPAPGVAASESLALSDAPVASSPPDNPAAAEATQTAGTGTIQGTSNNTEDATWQTITIGSGQSLARIFKHARIPARDLYDLQNSNDLGSKLARIYPGHQISYIADDTGKLEALRYSPGPLRTYEFRRSGERSFDAQVLTREPDRRRRFVEATIEHSLFLASQRADLDDEITMRLASIFQWDIDFVLDIRAGDSFAVLYEELYLDGEKIGNGDILAAQFVNRGHVHQAVNYTDSQGVSSFYSPDGRSMRKAFLRAPVEFSRISSNFNLRRVHPLYKRVMPHRGIDYAAPPGTPILAAGDGKVRIATRHKANGNYIVLQHGEQYQTKYLHLSRFAHGIRAGVRVRQGQTIGYVGSTGWATGPHLHYEFLVNGVHRNPRTVALPQATPVANSDRADFEQRAHELLAQLEAGRTTQLAHLSGGE